MSHLKKHKATGIVFLLLLVLTIGFIFSRSLHSSELSSIESAGVVNMLGGFLSGMGIETEQADVVVRKGAHFLEFFLFGIVLTLTVKYNSSKRIAKNIFLIGFFLLFIPVCDEAMQYFSPGRSPEVKDVWLDFFGAATGFAAMFFIDFLIGRFKKKSRGK